MGATIFRKFDLNRFSKVYPFLRRQPKYSYESNSQVVLESAILSFDGNNQVTYNFLNTYSSAPIVVATSQNDSFNVFIQSVSTTSVTIGASASSSYSVSIFVVSDEG